MSLTTPSKIRELQIKPYRKTKNEPGYRFYMLYDKVYREDIMMHAYALARANKGAPGVDEQTLEQMELQGVGEWLTGIGRGLRNSRLSKPPPAPPQRNALGGEGRGSAKYGTPGSPAAGRPDGRPGRSATGARRHAQDPGTALTSWVERATRAESSKGPLRRKEGQPRK